MDMLSINEPGLQLIENFEGLSLRAYRCPAGVLTCGYGHTGADVHAGLTITQAQADTWLRADLARAEAAVSRLVKVHVSENAFSALVALVFNIGSGAFSGSTLLRLLNAGQLQAAAAEFAKWNRVNGQPNEGLTRRRAAEARLFMTPDSLAE